MSAGPNAPTALPGAPPPAAVSVGGARRQAVLLVIAGPANGRSFRLSAPQATLGRGQDADFLLHDEGLSRLHARISLEGDDIVLCDLGSRNGTFVNGARIQRARLSDGDRIVLGSTTMLTLRLQDEADGSLSTRLYDEMLKDGLTGLARAGHFSERLAADFSFSLRHGSPLAVLLLGVDGFQQLLDEQGSGPTDAVLVELARRLQQAVRTEDLLARHDGDAFAVLARGLDDEHALQFAERLQRLVAERPFSLQGDAPGASLSVSIGVAVFLPGRFGSERELLAAAEAALFAAQGAGPGQVRLAPERGPVPLPGG